MGVEAEASPFEGRNIGFVLLAFPPYHGVVQRSRKTFFNRGNFKSHSKNGKDVIRKEL